MSTDTVELAAILKQIKVTNSDTDTYVTLIFQGNIDSIDINRIASLRHKALDLTIEPCPDTI
jgi:hypothetical protein